MLSTVEGLDYGSHALEAGSVFDREKEQEQEEEEESSAKKTTRSATAMSPDAADPGVLETPTREAADGNSTRDACCGGSEEGASRGRSCEKHCDEVFVFEELEKDVGSSDAVILRTIVESVLEFVTVHIVPIVEESSEVGKLGEGPQLTPRTSQMKRFASDLFEDAISDLSLAKDNDRCISPVLQRAGQTSGDCFPEAFDDALRDVTKRGCCRIPWALLRFIVVCKVHQIFENAPFPKRPHTPYPQREESLQPLRIALGHLWALKLAPFSVQRLAELLLSPRRHHKLARKLSYALVRIVGTVRIPLVHAIPTALSGLQELLKSDQKLVRALNAVNPWPYTLSTGPQDFSTLLGQPSLGFRLSCDALNLELHDSDDRRDSLDACSRTPSHGDPCWADGKDAPSSFSAGGPASHPPQRRLRNSVEIFTPRRGVNCDRQLSPQGQAGRLRASRPGYSKRESQQKTGDGSDEEEEDDDDDADDDDDTNSNRSSTEGSGTTAESGTTIQAEECKELVMGETLLLEAGGAHIVSGASASASPVFKKRRRVTLETECDDLPFDKVHHATTPPSRQRRRLCSSGEPLTGNRLTAETTGVFSTSDNLSFAFLRDIAVNDDDEDDSCDHHEGDANPTTTVDNPKERATSTHKEDPSTYEKSDTAFAHETRSDTAGDNKAPITAATSPDALAKPNALAALLSLAVPETTQGTPPLFENELAEGEKMLARERNNHPPSETQFASSNGDASAIPHNSCSVLLRDYFDEDFEECNGKKNDT